MNLNSRKFGLAVAIVFAIVWVICSLLVVAMPAFMMQMSGHMLHADLTRYGWTMHWGGFFFGLILWSVVAGALAWGVAAVYNRLLD